MGSGLLILPSSAVDLCHAELQARKLLRAFLVSHQDVPFKKDRKDGRLQEQGLCMVKASLGLPI